MLTVFLILHKDMKNILYVQKNVIKNKKHQLCRLVFLYARIYKYYSFTSVYGFWIIVVVAVKPSYSKVITRSILESDIFASNVSD